MDPGRIPYLARREAGRYWMAGHDADDLVQEAALAMWAALSAGESREGHLVMIARRRLSRLVRRPRPLPSLSREPPSREPDPAEKVCARDAVRAALASLPPRWRRVLRHTKRGHPDDVIAKRLRTTPANVRVMRHRARAAVLRHLEEER